MFREIRKKYEDSEHRKEDIWKYLDDTLSGLMMLSEIRDWLDDTVVERLEINTNGLFVVLNKSYYNIKFKIYEKDYCAVPIQMLCMGDYEPGEITVVRKCLSFFPQEQDFCFIDIGANLGLYSLLVEKMFKKKTIYAFEPGLKTYSRLIENCNINNSNVKAFNVGLYDAEEEQNFYYDTDASGASSLRNIRDKDYVVERVQLRRLDDIAVEEGIEKVDFIKLDIEGAELFAIRGGLSLISRSKPVIFCEMLRKWSALFGYNPNDIIALLSNMGYQCYSLGNGIAGIHLCPEVTDETEETNFFFFDTTKHSHIVNQLEPDSIKTK